MHEAHKTSTQSILSRVSRWSILRIGSVGSKLIIGSAGSIIQNEDQMDMLHMLIEGRRLRDIRDLPLDLAI